MLRLFIIFILLACPVRGLAVPVEPCNRLEDWQALLMVSKYEYGREAVKRFLGAPSDQQPERPIETTRAAKDLAEEAVAGPVATSVLRDQMLRRGFQELIYTSPGGKTYPYFVNPGLRQWVCPCGYSYDRMNSLEYHILRHLEERP